ncbi:MAG: SsrA-binding protein SmpB [Elusimicrobiota bacterium]
MKIIASNKKAFHDYFVLEQFEAGIILEGHEVKSVRQTKVNLKDSYVKFRGTEAYVVNMHISEYSHAAIPETYDPTRSRKLLMHKKELTRLMGKIKEKGLSVVPLEMYFNQKGIAKLKIGLVKGKKLYDKREVKKKRDIEREMERQNIRIK